MGLRMGEGEVAPADLPEDCGHQEFTLGCPRCFFEMKGITSGEIKMGQMEGHIEGAILFNWHLLSVFDSMEQQILPATTSIDLSQNMVAKAVIANLRQVYGYMVTIISDPQRLATALDHGAQLAKTMNDEIARRKGTGEPVPGIPAPTPLITLT